MRIPAQIALLVTILTAPWLLGGAHEWLQVYTYGGLLVAGLLALPVVVWDRDEQLQAGRIPAVAWVLFAAIGWAALQIVPLPTGVVDVVSPNAVELREVLVGPVGDRVEVSLRPEATRYDLRMLVMAVLAFWLAWLLFRSKRELATMLLAVSLNGAAFAFFGLIHKLTSNGQMYWIGPTAGAPFAGFVNRNSGGGYLNLCLGAAVVLLVWLRGGGRLSSLPMGEDLEEAHHQQAGKPAATFLQQPGKPAATFDGRELLLWTLAACMAGGVLGSLSRGAAISLFAGGVVTAGTLMLTRGRRGLAVWIVLLLVAGLGLLSWSGLTDAWQARFDQLRDQEHWVESGRVPNWEDALQSVPDFLWTGSGLRTYRDVYLMYQTRYSPSWHHYAENQYVQTLIDAGVGGLLLLVGVLGLVYWRIFRLIRRQESNMAFGLGIGLLFAMVTQSVHALSDFGLYMPGTTVLIAALCGVLVREHELPARGGRLSSLPISIALLGLAFWGWTDLRGLVEAKQVMRDAEFDEYPSGATAAALDNAIQQLQQHAETRPTDAELLYQLAKLHVHRYRVALLPEFRRAAPPEVSLDELWDRTAAERAREIESIDVQPLIEQYLVPAQTRLEQARAAAPLLAKVHLRLARVVTAIEGPDKNVQHIIRAVQCEPANTYVLSRAGFLHARAGRWSEAYELWQRCLMLNHDRIGEILAWTSDENLDLDTVVRNVFPQDTESLLAIAGRYARSDPTLFQHLVERIEETIESETDETLRLYLTGRLLALQDQLPQAIRHHALAVQARPDQVGWRYELAVLLERNNMTELAAQQATICARLEPRNRTYAALAERLQSN